MISPSLSLTHATPYYLLFLLRINAEFRLKRALHNAFDYLLFLLRINACNQGNRPYYNISFYYLLFLLRINAVIV